MDFGGQNKKDNICYVYKFHSSYFVICVTFVVLGFLYLYILIHIHLHGRLPEHLSKHFFANTLVRWSPPPRRRRTPALRNVIGILKSIRKGGRKGVRKGGGRKGGRKCRHD